MLFVVYPKKLITFVFLCGPNFLPPNSKCDYESYRLLCLLKNAEKTRSPFLGSRCPERPRFSQFGQNNEEKHSVFEKRKIAQKTKTRKKNAEPILGNLISAYQKTITRKKTRSTSRGAPLYFFSRHRI